jgi:hypothetical protein
MDRGISSTSNSYFKSEILGVKASSFVDNPLPAVSWLIPSYRFCQIAHRSSS